MPAGQPKGAKSQLKVLLPQCVMLTATANHQSLSNQVMSCPVRPSVDHDAAGIRVWLQILVRNPDVIGEEWRLLISVTALLSYKGGILLSSGPSLPIPQVRGPPCRASG